MVGTKSSQSLPLRSVTNTTKPPQRPVRERLSVFASPQGRPPVSAKREATSASSRPSSLQAEFIRASGDPGITANLTAISNPQAVKGVGWADDRGVRAEMEDAVDFVDMYAGSPRSAYFGVYDGHGGPDCVTHVVLNLHQILAHEIALAFVANQEANSDLVQGCHVSSRQAVPPALKRAFARVDQAMLRKGMLQSGCTACTCVLAEDIVDGSRTLHVAHVGDTRAVLARVLAHGTQAHRLTSESDHKATDPSEMERITKAGGCVVRDRVNGVLAISRALGDFELKEPALPQNVVSNVPDVVSVDITDQDLLVIVACDGLWDVVDDQEAVDLIIDARENLATQNLGNHGLSYEAYVLAQFLVEVALLKGSQDNITCLVVFL